MVYATIFRLVGHYRPALRVFASALAFKARDFSTLMRDRAPFVTRASGFVLMDVPQGLCVIKSDWHMTFC